MNKKDLVNIISKEHQISKKEASCILETALCSILFSLKKGDEVNLTGFGSFFIKKQAARPGRNPQTGEPIVIKAKRLPKFRPAPTLKNSM